MQTAPPFPTVLKFRLGWKLNAATSPNRRRPGTGEAGAVRLRRVLDDEQSAALHELAEPVHVADLAEQVHSDDRSRPLADELRRRRRVDQPGVGARTSQGPA